MKIIISLVLFLACSIQARAQGTVNFANNHASVVIDGCTGLVLVTGNTFIAELWSAPDNGSTPNDAQMEPITGARTGISPVAGLTTGGTKTTPNTTAPGGTAGESTASRSPLATRARCRRDCRARSWARVCDPSSSAPSPAPSPPPARSAPSASPCWVCCDANRDLESVGPNITVFFGSRFAGTRLKVSTLPRAT